MNETFEQQCLVVSKVLEMILDLVIACICFTVDVLGKDSSAISICMSVFGICHTIKFFNGLLQICGFGLIHRLKRFLVSHWNVFWTTVWGRFEIWAENARKECARRKEKCAHRYENNPGP
jgi:hypothetical protein